MLRPKPNIVVLVHKQEGLLRDFFFDLRYSLRVVTLKEGHNCCHIFLIPTVKEKWINLHASLHLHGKLGDGFKFLPTLV